MPSAPPDIRSLLLLLSEGENQQNQSVAPDIILTRDARGRFAEGRSGNPRGRPRGTLRGKYPMRNLRAHPVGGAALADLTRRKPYLLRRIASQFLPPAPPWGRDFIDGWPTPSLDPRPRRKRGST